MVLQSRQLCICGFTGLLVPVQSTCMSVCLPQLLMLAARTA